LFASRRALAVRFSRPGDLGVRRISVGGAPTRMAWTGFVKASKEMAEQGTFTEFANGFPGGELNKMFG